MARGARAPNGLHRSPGVNLSARARRQWRAHASPGAKLLLLLFNTTRTTSGPPSTGAAIAMDGGVAAKLLLLLNTTRTHSGLPSTGAKVRKCHDGAWYPREKGRAYSCTRDEHTVRLHRRRHAKTSEKKRYRC